MKPCGYKEYITLYGQENTLSETEKAAMRDIAQEQADRDESARLMDVIAAQLNQGTEPQYTLYNAIKCIGLLSHNKEWIKTCTAKLDAVYADLAQQCLFVDNAAVASERLDTQRADFIGKTQRALERQLNSCRKLTDEITAALATVNGMENQN